MGCPFIPYAGTVWMVGPLPRVGVGTMCSVWVVSPSLEYCLGGGPPPSSSTGYCLGGGPPPSSRTGTVWVVSPLPRVGLGTVWVVGPSRE